MSHLFLINLHLMWILMSLIRHLFFMLVIRFLECNFIIREIKLGFWSPFLMKNCNRRGIQVRVINVYKGSVCLESFCLIYLDNFNSLRCKMSIQYFFSNHLLLNIYLLNGNYRFHRFFVQAIFNLLIEIFKWKYEKFQNVYYETDYDDAQ